MTRSLAFLFLILIYLSLRAGPVLIGERIELEGQIFVVKKELGQGGYGSVYLIQSLLKPDVQWAMKIFLDNPKDTSSTPDQKRHLWNRAHQRVIQIDPQGQHLKFAARFARIQRNPEPSFDSAFDVGKASLLPGHPDADVVLLLPVASYDLGKKIRESRNSVAEKVRLAEKVLDDVLPELAFLAANSLVHNDIKPGNILADANGRFGLNDFDALVPKGRYIGVATPMYEAPERNTRQGSLPISDIYSLGYSLTDILFAPGFFAGIGKSSVLALTKFSEGLEEIKRVLSAENPELVPVFKKIEDFLRASLQPIPEIRKREILKISNAFSNETLMSYTPNVRFDVDKDRVQYFLEGYLEDSIKDAFVTSIVHKTENPAPVFTALAKEARTFVEAFRVAQRAGVIIENEGALFMTMLRSAPFHSVSQVETLKAYLTEKYETDPAFLSAEVGSVLLRRFVKPLQSDWTKYPWIFELVSKIPGIYDQHRDWFLEKIRSSSKLEEQAYLSTLFIPHDEIPSVITTIWLKALVDPKVVSSVKHSILLALKKRVRFESESVATFLSGMGDDEAETIRKLRAIRSIDHFPLSPSDGRIVVLLKASKQTIRLEAASTLAWYGNQSQIVQSTLMTAGLESAAIENLPRQFMFDQANQSKLVDIILGAGEDSENAFKMLARQSSLFPDTLEKIRGGFDLVPLSTRFYLAKIILSLDTSKAEDKATALTVLMEAVGRPRFEKAIVHGLIKKNLTAETWSKNFRKWTLIKRDRFSEAIKDIPEHFGSQDDPSDRQLARLIKKGLISSLDASEIDVLIAEMSSPRSNLGQYIHMALGKSELNDAQKSEMRLMVDKGSTRTNRYYAAKFMSKNYNEYNLAIEMALLREIRTEDVPKVQYSLQGLKTLLPLMDEYWNQNDFQLKDRCVGAFSQTEFDLETVQFLIRKGTETAYFALVSDIFKANPSALKQEAVRRFLELPPRASRADETIAPTVTKMVERGLSVTTFDEFFARLIKYENSSAIVAGLAHAVGKPEITQRLHLLRNSADSHIRSWASIVLYAGGEKSKENAEIILTHGLDKVSDKWLSDQMPLQDLTPGEIDTLVRVAASDSHAATTAWGALGYISKGKFLSNPNYLLIFKSKDPSIRFEALKKYADDLKITPEIVNSLVGLAIEAPEYATEVSGLLKGSSNEMSHESLSILVEDFLNPSSRTRSFSRQLLAKETDLPWELIQKIHERFPNRNYRELLGARFKQTPRTAECSHFYK